MNFIQHKNRYYVEASINVNLYGIYVKNERTNCLMDIQISFNRFCIRCERYLNN